jgi:hypothetical protein
MGDRSAWVPGGGARSLQHTARSCRATPKLSGAIGSTAATPRAPTSETNLDTAHSPRARLASRPLAAASLRGRASRATGEAVHLRTWIAARAKRRRGKAMKHRLPKGKRGRPQLGLPRALARRASKWTERRRALRISQRETRATRTFRVGTQSPQTARQRVRSTARLQSRGSPPPMANRIPRFVEPEGSTGDVTCDRDFCAALCDPAQERSNEKQPRN